MKKTKIIATIGPATWDNDILQRMIELGMNVARINTSFADFAELERVSKQIRALSDHVALMLDTKGHKLRVSELKRKVTIRKGQKFSLHTKKVKRGVYLVTESDLHLETQIPKDASILIDDGKIKMKVVDILDHELVCEVEQGGVLGKSKTVNIPGVHIDFPELSKKDYDDILAAKKLGFDFIAASYIRSVRDLHAIRKLTKGSDMDVIAKIEETEGVTNFNDILHESDGIMIARGDLGVEIPYEQVPNLQKLFIRKSNLLGKPVVVATQMLQSMTEQMTATRAEVNDVANAIYDGVDAVMLSSETSIGKHPVEAVETMNRIAREVEKSIDPTEDRIPSPLAKPTTNAIAKSVIDSCLTLPIDKILVATASGTTAKTIARFKPRQPIVAFTISDGAKRKLAMSRGIFADILDKSSSTRDTGVQNLVKCAKRKGYVSDSDMVIVVAGANIMGQGETNMMEINRVDHMIE